MAVEVAQDRGIHTPPEAGINPFTEKSARALAFQFLANRDKNTHVYHGSDAYVLGQMEVQGQVLTMLAQEHLLSVDPSEPFRIPALRGLRQLTQSDVNNLIGSYRVAQESYLDSEAERVRTKRAEIKPGEERIEGRRDTLAEILTDLGQIQRISSIDSQLRMRPAS